jgi:hypothetical protein
VMGLLSGVSRSLDSKVDLMGTLLPYALEAPPTSRAPSPGSASAPSAALNRPSPTPGA